MKIRHYATKVTVTLFAVFCLVIGAQATTKQEMGVVINLAGKQRMLTQKMSKEILLIAAGVDVDANKENLKKTATLLVIQTWGYLKQTMLIFSSNWKPSQVCGQNFIKMWTLF